MRNLLTLIELRLVLTDERAEAESRAAGVRGLEEDVPAAEEDSELLRMARARVDDLTAERASLTVET